MSSPQKRSPSSNAVRVPLARRLSALFAIAALTGALIAAGFAIVRGDAWRLPLVLVAVAAAVVGLWYALSRRGAPSWAGLLMAAGGALLLVLVIVTSDYRGLPFAVALVLIALSAFGARYALGRNSRTLPAALKTPSPNHPVLIINLKSGGGKAEQYGIAEECHARGIEPVILEPGDDLSQLAVDAIARGADVIGMAGGDGSQALVATLASQSDVPYVCVPAGTRNHFALDLGLDRDDVVGALDAFHDGVERRIDLARVNGRVFVNNASLGLYAKIVQSPEYRDAKLETAAHMLPDLIGPDRQPFDLQFVGPDGTEYPTAHLLLVSNNPYELTHLAGRGSRARLDSGTLGIVAARISGPNEAVTFVGLEAIGRVRNFPGWLEWNAPAFRIDSAGPVEIGIDGEALLMEPPLVFESLPAALRVRIPSHSPGSAPAATAVQLSGSTVRDLLRVSAGRAVDAR
jgi:diacylglycerol kinase family enzyme